MTLNIKHSPSHFAWRGKAASGMNPVLKELTAKLSRWESAREKGIGAQEQEPRDQ